MTVAALAIATPTLTLPAGVSLSAGALKYCEPLTREALELVASLHRRLNDERLRLLEQRTVRQAAYDQGALPEYPAKESIATQSDWRVAPIPEDLRCRRVEITGPVNSAKMVINMLSRNSAGDRADCAMLDFEDSMKPAWRNVMDGIANVRDAINGELRHVEPATGTKAEKVYQLDTSDMAKLMVRVRGLHLEESNVVVDEQPVSAGLFDLVMTAYHTAKTQVARGETPKFYVPKIEGRAEAYWWNALFKLVEQELELSPGAIRATFLIETLPAAFQIEEILYELRDHVAGLNVGRWDKIFSDIKTLRFHKDRIMADRASIGLNRNWMANYAKRLIRICHRRGAYALGGMAAFTPGRDTELRDRQTRKVLEDKALEASWGHDGCWVSHPFFIGVARAAFKNDHQLDVIPGECFQFPDLLPRSEGPKTLIGLRTNIRVGIAYMHGWLQDVGCIAWDNLMEDLATLEISRSQVWQWLHHEVVLDEGTRVTPDLVSGLFEDEFKHILNEVYGDLDTWEKAKDQARELFLQKDFQEFLSMRSDVARD